jgi:endonuclease/exonuclease/phosphatase family metal-dependent hydrolase
VSASLRPLASSIVLALLAAACGGSAPGASSTGAGAGGHAATTTSSGAGAHGGAATTTSSGAGGAAGQGGAGGAGGATTTSSGDGGGPSGARVRIVAANLTSGNAQSYDPGEGIRILRGVAADVVLMQEMNYGDDSPAKIRELADQVCGPSCEVARGAGQIPNGVVSRHPIVGSGTWADPKVANRDFTWAHIDVPGTTDLWAVSVHLLTTSADNRDAEAHALVDLLHANVPAGDFVVVGGDLNTDARGEAAIATFSALLSTAAPYPADNLGNDATNGTRKRPHDWVLPSPELRARETPVVIGAAAFDAGLVVDTRVYVPIEDLSPALDTDSGAPGMQHMAVVRDFLLE